MWCSLVVYWIAELGVGTLYVNPLFLLSEWNMVTVDGLTITTLYST